MLVFSWWEKGGKWSGEKPEYKKVWGIEKTLVPRKVGWEGLRKKEERSLLQQKLRERRGMRKTLLLRRGGRKVNYVKNNDQILRRTKIAGLPYVLGKAKAESHLDCRGKGSLGTGRGHVYRKMYTKGFLVLDTKLGRGEGGPGKEGRRRTRRT